MRGDPGDLESDSAAQPAALRYGLAAWCVAAGVSPASGSGPFWTPSCCSSLSWLRPGSAVCGRRCGLGSGSLALDYFFAWPFYSLTLDLGHIPRLRRFTLFAALFATASAARRKAEQSLKQARDELELQRS